MECLKRNKYFIFLILFCFFFYISGIKWGIPSNKLNDLYFYKKGNLEKALKLIKNYKDEIWKGYGYFLTLHPGEAERKLPRNLYNPIRSYHPDEYFVIKVISVMQPEKFNFNPYQFAIGGTYLYLVGFILFILSKFNFIKLIKDISFYFYNLEEIGKFYIVGRTITTFYGIGIILLSYLVVKKIYPKESQRRLFLIPFLISVTPLMILNSSYMYVDVPGIFWIMVCLYYSLKTIDNPSFKKFFIVGIFSGLAAGTKITFIVSIIIPLLTSFLIYKRPKNIIISSIYSAGGLILSFGITNPYFFITFPLPIVELSEHTPLSFSGKFYFNALGYGIGWPVFIVCLIGLFNKINFMDKRRLILFGWAIFYFLFISLFSKNFARYILPLVPSFIILGFEIWIKEWKKFNILKNITLGLFVLFTFIYGMSYKMLFIKENIRTEAGMWIKENIPEGSSIGVTEIPWQFQMPPFDYYVYKVDVTGYNIEELKKKQPEYFILSSFQAPIPPYPLRLQKERINFYNEFVKSGLYQIEKKFEKYPSFAGINFRFKSLPEDLIYLNPTIVVYRKIAYNK